MKKFIVYLLVIVVAVSLGFAVFFLVRDNEVISISSATIYKDAGSQPFTIDVNHTNKKSYTKITISVSDENVVNYDSSSNSFSAIAGGVARINFRTTNAKFRNLWCDVIVGDGTEESPFYISTPEQLAAIGMGVADENGVYQGAGDFPQYTSSACYKLVANIDAKYINNGYWIPLRAFSGRFDGNGFTISNVSINREKYNSFASENEATFDPTIFTSENVGLFQEITPTGMVYNLKLENVTAEGRYTNFGSIAAINKGLIERIEIKDAKYSVETDVFGGIAAKNITTESGANDTYVRNIARIDRCSINMTLGKKTIINDDGTSTDAVLGITGIIGGLVGDNNGGNILYSYVNGEVSFAQDTTAIIYGGLVGNNRYIELEKFAGKYTTVYQGANIKDCYSNLKAYLIETPTNSATRIAGAIGVNHDLSDSLYDNDSNKKVVNNYIIGVYYNKDNLNTPQDNINKAYTGIAEFIVGGATIPYADEKMIIYGLTDSEMRAPVNYDSHTTYENGFDENGNSLGIQTTQVKWQFGTIWAQDAENNDQLPYLNYQLIYIPDDFIVAGTPIILQNNRYTFEKGDPDFPITIVSGTDGKLTLMKGETYQIKITPAGSKVTWTSSDSTCVSVDSTGKITANSVGSATITAATKGGSVDSITVIVTDLTYKIYNYQDTLELVAGQTYQLSNIKVEPATTLTYASENTAIATVDATGKITAVSAGNTVINVSAGITTVGIKLTVKESDNNSQVTLTLNETQINDTNFTQSYTGKVIVMTAMLNSTNILSQLTFSYYSTDANVVSVNSLTGEYRVVGTGRASITVSVSTPRYIGSASVYFDISSTSTEVENISISPSAKTLYIGETLQLVVSGTASKLSFSSENTNIAVVDSKTGLVKGLAKGSTYIKATAVRSDGSYATARCYVTVQQRKAIVLTLTPGIARVVVNTPVVITASADTETGFEWELADPTTATISASGNKATITPTKAGQTILIVRSSVNPAYTAGAIIEAFNENEYVQDIYNVDQLLNIANHRDRKFRLCANIDLSGIEWKPLCTKVQPFTGSFVNAGNYKITNLTVKDGVYSGLFGYVSMATIKGIIIENANVTGRYAGALAGYVFNSKVTNCSAKDVTINATQYAGGIAGYTSSKAVIDNCVVSGSTAINATETGTKYVGGITGYLKDASIQNSSINITKNIAIGSGASGYAGGIAGYATGAISDCHIYSANIIANDSDTNYAGGIVGITNSNITKSIVEKASITGYYAGGIGGEINVASSVSLSFSDYKKGFRRDDLSSSSYSTNVSQCGIRESVVVTGEYVGGLFGVISSGVVSNSYTRATLKGDSGKAVKGGFASLIKSNGMTNSGGAGQVGIVEYSYSACKFSGPGTAYAITQSYVHNYNASNTRDAGYCFNYVFDDDVDGKATYHKGSNIFAKDTIEAKKSTSEMKNSTTFTNKGFSSGIWAYDGDYPTLKFED